MHPTHLNFSRTLRQDRHVSIALFGLVFVGLFFVGLFFASNALAHGMSEEDQHRMMHAGLTDFIELGASHMLTGYDHLLFLFGVVFFLTRFPDIIKFVTAFTIGHSITLVFATIFHIHANYYLIDAVIALTVVYKAFENLDGFKRFLNSGSPNLTWMVFGFGLIHGFGLSTRLQQLPLGHDGIILKILAFNVGVEVGQVVALAVMLLLLLGWRKTESFQRFSKASNVLLLLAGGLLLLHQLHGYQHSAYRDEFPLNADDHAHVHADMETAARASASAIASELEDDTMPPNSMPDPVLTAPAEPAEPEPATTHSHGDGKHHSH